MHIHFIGEANCAEEYFILISRRKENICYWLLAEDAIGWWECPSSVGNFTIDLFPFRRNGNKSFFWCWPKEKFTSRPALLAQSQPAWEFLLWINISSQVVRYSCNAARTTASRNTGRQCDRREKIKRGREREEEECARCPQMCWKKISRERIIRLNSDIPDWCDQDGCTFHTSIPEGDGRNSSTSNICPNRLIFFKYFLSKSSKFHVSGSVI